MRFMVYAKQIIDGELSAIFAYDYTPEFGEDSDMVIITEEEYNTLLAELIATQPVPDPNAITDSEALRIITGEVDADEIK